MVNMPGFVHHRQILFTVSLGLVVSTLSSPIIVNVTQAEAAEAFVEGVKEVQQFERQNENLIARNDLPCESDSKVKLQCASVREAVRKWRRRSWFKSHAPAGSSLLFDEV